jgi:hypothetical protein
MSTAKQTVTFFGGERIGEMLDMKTKMPAKAGWKQVAEF